MTLEEAILHAEEVAEENEKTILYYTIQGDKEWLDECEKDCIECANEHRQLAEWLRELKAYKELNTYNRSNKCSKCKYEDSAYFCDDCIWNFVNKFEQKEVQNEISD
jgi:hypothetical protein